MTIYSDQDPKALLDELLRKYKIVQVLFNAGWFTDNTGSGVTGQYPFRLSCQTGATANSRALVYTYTFGLNSGDKSGYTVDYSKRLEWEFNLLRRNSDSEAVARIQLKQVNTEGQLADVGVGLQINNYAITGEAHGTSRDTVSLGSLSNNKITNVKIVVIPATRVEFWINRTLEDTLEGAAVPIDITDYTYLVVSIINGSTGGVNAVFEVGNIVFIQEW